MHLSSKHTWAGKERKGEKFLMFTVDLLHTEHEHIGKVGFRGTILPQDIILISKGQVKLFQD